MTETESGYIRAVGVLVTEEQTKWLGNARDE